MDVRAELVTKLESMCVPEDVREDLSRMIHKGLVLYPEQLDFHASSPREKHEAKGFDYVGKVRIIEHALSQPNLVLEITTRSKEGNPVKQLIKPVELSKAGSDLDLVGKALPDQHEVRFKIRSISFVRSVRGALYVDPKSGKS